VNPLFIHLYRADQLRRFHGHPPLLTSFNDAVTTEIREGIPQQSQPLQTGTSIIRADITIRRLNVNNIQINLEDSANVAQFQQDLLENLSSVPSATPAPMIESGPYAESSDVSVNLATNTPRKRERLQKPPTRTIVIGLQTIEYTTDDVEWPHGVIEFTDDVSRLFHEWHQSDLVKLKGTPVPMKAWGDLFHWVSSDAWQTLKKKYSEAKV
jgi:hypothetical protein